LQAHGDGKQFDSTSSCASQTQCVSSQRANFEVIAVVLPPDLAVPKYQLAAAARRMVARRKQREIGLPHFVEETLSPTVWPLGRFVAPVTGEW
jgi:hypothetical protein